MTPTSDERREVAEQLREARPSTYYAEELVELIKDALLPAFSTETWREPTDVLAALADLIDPTCHVVSEALHTGSFGCEEAGTEFTLSCGHTVIVDGDFPPGYCDECGARVVRDDDQR